MRNIRINENYRPIVDKLAQSTHNEAGKTIFSTMRELICFSAVLGFEYERKRNLPAKTYEVVDGRIFSNSQQSIDLMYLIALASSRDVDILREDNENRMVEIFEEFCNGGFEILKSWLEEKPEDVNGDQAILAALSKYKFLETLPDLDEATREVAF